VVGLATTVVRFFLLDRRPSFRGAFDEIAIKTPERDEEFPNRFVPKSAVPKPLDGAVDEVGGIESITIGGKRYWFGYSYEADMVLSPLIDDRRVMAQFGSDFMLQRDGAHPPEYWDELVASAVNLSELASDPGERDFTGVEIRDALREVEAARREKRPAKDLKLSTYLAELLDETNAVRTELPGACATDAGVAIRRLDKHDDCLRAALKVVSGKTAPPGEATLDDAFEIVSDQIASWRETVPENWRSLLLRD
jgi:hypothetical protein